MAEQTKNVEEVEDKDPWDFEDPEIEDTLVADADIPAETEEDTDVSSEDPAEEIVLRAKEAGLTQEDMDNMGSPDTLEFVLNLLDQKIQKVEEEAKNTTQETGDAVSEDVDSEPSSDDFDWIDKLDPDESVDSDSVKALKAMKTRLDEMSGTVKAMTEQSRTAKSESFFAQLDDQWNELFGNAKEQTDRNKANRQTVVDEMESLRAGYRSRKKRIPEETELFERALRSTFGEHEKNFARNEVEGKIKKRSSQFISRAQSRPTKELLTGREKAVSSVSARMRELGLSNLDDIGETFE
ncbi:MAG: hypothetical protein GOVbin1630_52 [Prokaryotic dsDNA virus sp.]|nr:MAG: hypothetical protein GOVbin1630_52 [Prokaryotic dsDNA virus sp.]|tara:strand:+ start:6000 stop:6887 length:888 start_codon:yes stop_codon:yes gene_type:complete